MIRDILQVSCPAKVNLALSVGSPLPENGYHPLASWMVALNFGDHLELEKAGEGPSRFDLGFDPAAPKAGSIDWPIEKDLAFRAHRLLEQEAGRSLAVRLTLRKHIPTGAGLGGGSSDAAATLVGINEHFGLKLPETVLMRLAQQLGSDVGFLVGAMLGKPSALVTGLGETVEPLALNEPIHLVLIFPPFGCPTAEVYRALDELRQPTDRRFVPETERVRALATRRPLPADAPFNDLAQAACVVEPGLDALRKELSKKLRLPVHVTGSGSTLFVIAPSQANAKALARKVGRMANLAAVATRTLAGV